MSVEFSLKGQARDAIRQGDAKDIFFLKRLMEGDLPGWEEEIKKKVRSLEKGDKWPHVWVTGTYEVNVSVEGMLYRFEIRKTKLGEGKDFQLIPKGKKEAGKTVAHKDQEDFTMDEVPYIGILIAQKKVKEQI